MLEGGMMTEHNCDCGCTPGHSRPEECAANRASTQAYMSRIAMQPMVETRDMKAIREAREKGEIQ